MDFDSDIRAAAHKANSAVNATIKKYRSARITDEPDITGVLIGQLDARLEGEIGTIQWSSSIVRSASGTSAEEKEIGADLVINVKMKAYGVTYNKGVLVQSKRLEFGSLLSPREGQRLHDQCQKMIDTTSNSAYVFAYSRDGMRCGGAASFYEEPKRDIYQNCPWTPYRFFWELFRCPIGDPRIQSSLVRDLPVPNVIKLVAKQD